MHGQRRENAMVARRSCKEQVPPGVRLAWWLTAAGLAAFTAHAALGFGGRALDAFFTDWLYNGLYLASAGICFTRGLLGRDERLPWLAFGAAITFWSAGFVYYALELRHLDVPPTPSPSDALWLCFYPLVYMALSLLMRARLPRLYASLWLDGLTGALAFGAVGAAVLVGPIVASTQGSTAAVATGLAYPLCDLLLLIFVFGLFGATQWRPGRAWSLLLVAFALTIVADTIYLHQTATGSYSQGTLLDAIWPAASLVVAYAAWRPSADAKRIGRIPNQRLWLLVLPAAFTAMAVAVLAYGSFESVQPAAAALALAALAAALIRTGLTLRETHHLRDLAREDPLTGLSNYREFHEALERELPYCRRSGSALAVVLFDLDGFKRVNDNYGHARGDEVLRRVARTVRTISGRPDIAARLGGDEFGLLLPGADSRDAGPIAERIKRAVEDLDAGVGVSYGIGAWPDDGPSKEMLLLRADVALYAAKPSRKNRRRLDTAALVASACGEPAPEHPTRIEQVLAAARGQLGMEIAYVSEFGGGAQVISRTDGPSESFGLGVGTSIPLEETYCQRMVDARLPNVIPDAKRDDRVRGLPVTRRADIGAYIGVPVKLSDGRLYGTLCCLSHDFSPSLTERDAQFMHVLGRLVADQLEQDHLEQENHRLSTEGTSISALLVALDARDRYTGEHSESVVRLSGAVARGLERAEELVTEVEQVARLHDIGKIGVSDAILQKRGPLDDREWEIMREHPRIGAQIVASIESIAHLAPLVRAEHERWDGSGYPDGLAGEEVPLPSRIVFACDAYHAMTSDRPYRRALDPDEALAELAKGAGNQFDPAVIEVLLQLLRDDRVPQAGSAAELSGAL